MYLKVKLENGAFSPERAHPMDAGLDLKTPYSFDLYPGEHKDIDTGVHVEVPDGYVGQIASKSGLMLKGVTSRGTIDSSYRGSVHAVLFNASKQIVSFEVGDKITQLVIVPCAVCDVKVVDKLSETDRGDAGFGSTGR